VTCNVVVAVKLEEVTVVYLRLVYCTTLSLLVTRTKSVHPGVPEESLKEYFEGLQCFFRPCIVIYQYNRTDKMHYLLSVYFD
jgi:hypothetical protein